jgi:hypothetical protein
MIGYRGNLRAEVETVGAALQKYSTKAWMAAALATAAALVVIGLPTAIYENPFFVRMTPVRPQDYVIWALSAALLGLIAGSYFAVRPEGGDGKIVSGGLLSAIAVGCPTCNKLVVALVGTSGALNVFEPLQLYLGVFSVILLVWALLNRARALKGICMVEPVASQEEGLH